MDSNDLVAEALDQGETLWRAFDAVKPVKAAFWVLRDEEISHWTLVIASDAVNAANKLEAYHEVAQLMHSLSLHYLFTASYAILPGDDRMVRDAINVRAQFPGTSPLRCPVSRLGGTVIKDAYLYALPASVSRQVEKVTVFRPAEQEILDRLGTIGTSVQVQRLGEQYYSSRARYKGNQKDSRVTYGESVYDTLLLLLRQVEIDRPELVHSPMP